MIVGAGPAGSAAALGALAERPRSRVLLVDRARFPRDKTCGDGIGPDAVAALDRLGAAGVLEGAARIDRLRLSTAAGAVAEGAVDRPGYVLPRMVFDARLRELAHERGAEPARERIVTVAADAGGAGVVLNGRIRARTVVGADGANSVVRRLAGGGAHPRRYRAHSLRGYARAPGLPRRLEFRLPRDPWPAYAWAFPNAQGDANVGVVALDGRSRLPRARLLRALEALLPELPPSPGTVRGFALPLTPGRPALAHGRVLLAGDAAGLVNPLSGEGIATALVSGMLAGACAVARDDPGPAYAAAMRRRLGRHLRHADLAARALGRRALVDRAVAAAGVSPRAFEALAGLTVGTGHVGPGLAVRAAVEYAAVRARARRPAARSDGDAPG